MMEEIAAGIDDISIAIENGGKLTIDHFCYARDDIGGREEVASVEETDIITINTSQTFVHSVIDTLVRF